METNNQDAEPLAPHQGPGHPGFYLYSLMILVSFVLSFLSNPRLRVGIQNNLVPISNSSNFQCYILWCLSFLKFVYNKRYDTRYDYLNVYDNYLQVIGNDDSLQVHLREYYLLALREYELLNDFLLDNSVLFLDLKSVIFVYWRILFDLRFRFIVVVLTLIF